MSCLMRLLRVSITYSRRLSRLMTCLRPTPFTVSLWYSSVLFYQSLVVLYRRIKTGILVLVASGTDRWGRLVGVRKPAVCTCQANQSYIAFTSTELPERKDACPPISKYGASASQNDHYTLSAWPRPFMFQPHPRPRTLGARPMVRRLSEVHEQQPGRSSRGPLI